VDVTIYLPDEIGAWAKNQELPLSRMLREAVEDERRRRDAAARLAAEAKTYMLDVREPDGDGSTEVYRGEDGKVYVHDFEGQLSRDLDPGSLREIVDVATYVKAMRALGQVPVIDVGLA
jgi:hypothetical protein